jgi:hypothetical protein
VGAYNVSTTRFIEAEEYFDVTGGTKQQQLPLTKDHFEVVGLGAGSSLVYPKLSGAGGAQVTLLVSNGGTTIGTVTLQTKPSAGGGDVPTVSSSCSIHPTGGWNKYTNVTCGTLQTDDGAGAVDLTLAFAGGSTDGGGSTEFAHLDRISFGGAALLQARSSSI